MQNASLLGCNLTGNVTGNWSSCPHSLLTPSAPIVNPYNEFFKFAFGSAIYMIIVSFTTIVANGLLLWVFFFDPLKTFKNATTYFLVSLALVDILTALTQEQMYAACFIKMYLRHLDTVKVCMPLLTIGQTISLDASFLIVLAFTVAQYIVVTSPLNHARKVTKTRVMICVLSIYLYAIVISFSPLIGIPSYIQFTIELYLFVISICLSLIIYILLYIAFKKKMAVSNNLREDNIQTGVERKFITVNFLLIAILIFCTQPYATWGVLRLHSVVNLSTPKVLITYLFMENLLYLKFLLDPFVYAWRIPKYRQALKIVLRCGREEAGTRSTLDDRIVAQINKSRETVVSIDLKRLSLE